MLHAKNSFFEKILILIKIKFLNNQITRHEDKCVIVG